MASSSKAYAKGDGSDLQQVVDETEALSIQSDNTSDAESEASIDDEDVEEEEDKKSRDGDDMTFKRDPDDPEGDVGEDATTNTEIVVIEQTTHGTTSSDFSEGLKLQYERRCQIMARNFGHALDHNHAR